VGRNKGRKRFGNKKKRLKIRRGRQKRTRSRTQKKKGEREFWLEEKKGTAERVGKAGEVGMGRGRGTHVPAGRRKMNRFAVF